MYASRSLKWLSRNWIPIHTNFRSSSTVDAQEADKFLNLSSDWWKNRGSYSVLHSLNKLRVPLVRDGLINTKVTNSDLINSDKPLTGIKILDVGCGGGILSEALSRIGAKVTGIDATAESIDEAKCHASLDDEIAHNLNYVCCSIEDLKKIDDSTEYDAVVASEVVEHVKDLVYFLSCCSGHLKTGGSLFITTLNQTWLSYILAIVAAEKVMRIVPNGTHDWNKFVDPKDLQYTLESHGLATRLLHGMCYNPISGQFNWTRNTDVNYALHAVKR